MKTISSSGYEIYTGKDSLKSLKTIAKKFSSVFVLTDQNALSYCMPQVFKHVEEEKCTIIVLQPGEGNKNLQTCSAIWEQLAGQMADRNALLINVGGGVIGDMGGFAASCYKRGISFVQIPTTLLSMVDASVGGKTGIDLDGLKNIIGTFAVPEAVIINPSFIQTLPEGEKQSGFAEMLKHGLIADKKYYQQLLKQKDGQLEISEKEILRSVEIKNEIIKKDPKEKGLRKLLNFGHTVGHALETYSLQHDKKPLVHGHAVALGMIAEAYLSALKGRLSAVTFTKITNDICRFYPLYRFKDKSFTKIYKHALNDKKNNGNKIKSCLLVDLGKAIYDQEVNKEEFMAALEYLNNLYLTATK